MESSSATPKGDGAVHDRRQFLADSFCVASAGIIGALLATMDDVQHGGPRTNANKKNRRSTSRERSDFERFILPNGIYTGLMLLLIQEARHAYKQLTTIRATKKL